MSLVLLFIQCTHESGKYLSISKSWRVAEEEREGESEGEKDREREEEQEQGV